MQLKINVFGSLLSAHLAVVISPRYTIPPPCYETLKLELGLYISYTSFSLPTQLSPSVATYRYRCAHLAQSANVTDWKHTAVKYDHRGHHMNYL